MALCEVALSHGSDLVAKEIEFGQGWNSPSHTGPTVTRPVQDPLAVLSLENRLYMATVYVYPSFRLI